MTDLFEKRKALLNASINDCNQQEIILICIDFFIENTYIEIYDRFTSVFKNKPNWDNMEFNFGCLGTLNMWFTRTT